MRRYLKIALLLLLACVEISSLQAQVNRQKRIREYFEFYSGELEEMLTYVADYVAKEVTSRSKRNIQAEFLPYEKMEVVESENLLVCPTSIAWRDSSTGELCKVWGKLYTYLPYSMREVTGSATEDSSNALGESLTEQPPPFKTRFRYETGNDFLFRKVSNAHLESLKETKMLVIQLSGVHVPKEDVGIIRYE